MAHSALWQLLYMVRTSVWNAERTWQNTGVPAVQFDFVVRSSFIKIRYEAHFEADGSRFEWRDPPHRIGRTQKGAYTDLRSADAHPGRHCCADPSSK